MLCKNSTVAVNKDLEGYCFPIFYLEIKNKDVIVL